MDFKKIEAGLKQLMESQLVRAFRGSRPEDRVLPRLMEALSANTRIDQTGQRVAPNVYTISVKPETADFWHRQLSTPALVDSLREMAAQAGVRLLLPPTVEIMEDPDVTREHEFQVSAAFEQTPVNETQDLASHVPIEEDSLEGKSAPENAFLIVDGATQFALAQPVVNVGRRLDNQLVIDDPRVSRHHAQLRAIDGRYVLFDLNSSGGSFVNGQRTSQSTLRAGDVISLAGVTLIYAQDSSLTEPHRAATAPHQSSGDRPTIVGEHRGSAEKPTP